MTDIRDIRPLPPGAGSVYQPTMSLRWFIDPRIADKRLQQAWISNKGEHEWRDVPDVTLVVRDDHR